MLTGRHPLEPEFKSIAPGDVLLGKYRVEHELGKGGMSLVLAVHHMELGERFAMKLLIPAAMTEPSAVDRFLREAQVCARIHHEHIARVYDVGRLDGGTPYMIMEYLDGCNLQELAQKRGLLPVDEVVEHVLQACDGLAAMHEHGVVHRDLKPANLFAIRREDGRPCTKVIDFGISKVIATEGGNLTRSGMILGTILYMSPEQLRCPREVGIPADIWGIGVVLYELLTGKAPFARGAIAVVMGHILNTDPPPPRTLRPDLPPWLDAVVMKCLQKEPEERFQTMEELASALRSRGDASETATLHGASSELTAEIDLPDMPFAVLVREQGYDAVVVTRPAFTIGRSPSMDYTLRDGDVSRHHATLLRQRDGVFVEDNGSSHGTLVNGIKISQMKLRSGDIISIEAHEMSAIICASLEAAQQEARRAVALGRQRMEATTDTVLQIINSPHYHFLAAARRVKAICKTPVACLIQPVRIDPAVQRYGPSIVSAIVAEIARALSTQLPDSFIFAKASGAQLAAIATADRAPQALAKVEQQVKTALPLDVQVGSDRVRFSAEARAVSLDEALMTVVDK
jgi:serine/threonine protein kinase